MGEVVLYLLFVDIILCALSSERDFFGTRVHAAATRSIGLGSLVITHSRKVHVIG